MFFSRSTSSDTLNATDAIAKLEALYKSQAVIEFNLDGTIITANQNFLSLMEYDLSEVQNRHHSIFVEAGYRESPEYKAFWETLRAGKYRAAQYMRLTKSDKEVWIEASYNPILDKDGLPYKIVKFATDITAQKMINAEYESKLNAVGKSQAIIEFNLDGTIVTANENFCSTIGYSLDEIKGKHHSMFVELSFKDSPEYKTFWDDLRKGKFQAAKYRRVGKGDREVWLEASYNPVCDLKGRPYKVVKFATDITQNVQRMISIKRDMAVIDKAIDVLNEQSTSASSAALQTTNNVQTVAAGSEELHASVVEISQNMAKSAAAADDAYTKVEETDVETQKLLLAAQAMNGIVSLIQKIAEQVNLLSLNATIEAARAGEAGKGFAVVASEVKNLASQVAEATHKIGGEINNIQNVVSIVANGLAAITTSIDNARNFVTVVAGAVEEQSAVARDMSSNMQSASQAVNEVSHSLTSISTALVDITSSVNQTKVVADKII